MMDKRVTLRRMAALIAGALAALCLTASLGWVTLAWWANRAVPEPGPAARRVSYERGVGWLMARQDAVLAEANVALWWMLKTAAARTADPRLRDLYRRYLGNTYQGKLTHSVWRRLVEPGDTITIDADPHIAEGLEPYQRFFLHAATCHALPSGPEGQGTDAFLQGNVCRPMWSRVWLHDRVCTTHQLLGLRLYRQSACALPPGLDAIEAGLLDDVETQLRVSPVMQDSYIQRVLVLQWSGRRGAVRPVWVARIMAAQRRDGGWARGAQIPELPSWLQPSAIKHGFRRMLGWSTTGPEPEATFHATAQGILLMALTLDPDSVGSAADPR